MSLSRLFKAKETWGVDEASDEDEWFEVELRFVDFVTHLFNLSLTEHNVVVVVDDKDVGAVEEPLSCALEVRVLVAVKVVKSKDVVVATLQGEGDMRCRRSW
ncbi:aryl-alcohol dehydrogenase [Sesbania bispinosa]|nr:aryl-alcohol dehydrogenase [Sesbania bispinosa]